MQLLQDKRLPGKLIALRLGWWEVRYFLSGFVAIFYGRGSEKGSGFIR